MMDAQTAAAAPPAPVRREDYRPPDWLVPDIALEFELGAEKTRVRSRLSVTRNGEHDRPLVLDAEELELISVRVDGAPAEYRLEDDLLTIALSGATTIVE